MVSREEETPPPKTTPIRIERAESGSNNRDGSLDLCGRFEDSIAMKVVNKAVMEEILKRCSRNRRPIFTFYNSSLCFLHFSLTLF